MVSNIHLPPHPPSKKGGLSGATPYKIQIKTGFGEGAKILGDLEKQALLNALKHGVGPVFLTGPDVLYYQGGTKVHEPIDKLSPSGTPILALKLVGSHIHELYWAIKKKTQTIGELTQKLEVQEKLRNNDCAEFEALVTFFKNNASEASYLDLMNNLENDGASINADL